LLLVVFVVAGFFPSDLLPLAISSSRLLVFGARQQASLDRQQHQEVRETVSARRNQGQLDLQSFASVGTGEDSRLTVQLDNMHG
jgi:hypothetical protein